VFNTDLYVQVSINRVVARNIDTGQSSTQASVQPFSHPRMLVGNFTEAQATVKRAVAEAKGSGVLKVVRVLMHPIELTSGGLSQVEERVLHELALGAGASKAVVWVGAVLSNDAVSAKLNGN
jgi:rod shape-determining protein MreB